MALEWMKPDEAGRWKDRKAAKWYRYMDNQQFAWWERRLKISQKLNKLVILDVGTCWHPHARKLRNVLGLVDLLEARIDELTSLDVFTASASDQIAVAVLELIDKLHQLRYISLGIEQNYDGIPLVVVPVPVSVLRIASMHPNLRRLHLKNMSFTRETMAAFCQDLRKTQAPLHTLMIQFGIGSEDTMTILAQTLPRMWTLRTLSLQNSSWTDDDIFILFEHLRQCQKMKYLTVERGSGSPDLQLTTTTLKAMIEAMQQMSSLVSLYLSHFVCSPGDWTVLARGIADCPHLVEFHMWSCDNRVNLSVDNYKALLSIVGNHPRLTDLGLRFQGPISIYSDFYRRQTSARNNSLVALVSGAMVHRVGKNSSCWKVSRDVFRRLGTFLPEDAESSGRKDEDEHKYDEIDDSEGFPMFYLDDLIEDARVGSEALHNRPENE